MEELPSALLTALGLLFFLEGLVLALFPRLLERMLLALADVPPDVRRLGGLAAMVLGVLLVWAVRASG
jgi:uncharacterized protein YjeT (DUF2065 family)